MAEKSQPTARFPVLVQAVDHVLGASRFGKVPHEFLLGDPVVESENTAGRQKQAGKRAKEPLSDPNISPVWRNSFALKQLPHGESDFTTGLPERC